MGGGASSLQALDQQTQLFPGYSHAVCLPGLLSFTRPGHVRIPMCRCTGGRGGGASVRPPSAPNGGGRPTEASYWFCSSHRGWRGMDLRPRWDSSSPPLRHGKLYTVKKGYRFSTDTICSRYNLCRYNLCRYKLCRYNLYMNRFYSYGGGSGSIVT